MKVRPTTRLEWEVIDENNANGTIVAPQSGDGRLRAVKMSPWQWRLIVFAATLLLLASFIGVVRLVNQAQQNIAQTEREVELAVEADFFRQDSAAPKPDIQAIELQNDLAVVTMGVGDGAVAEGEPVAAVTAYYRYSAEGWQRVEADKGDRGLYLYQETDHFLFQFYQADQSVVEALVPGLEAFNNDLHRDIGLEVPPAHGKAYIRVLIEAGTQQNVPLDLVDYVAWNNDGIIVLSPKFSRVSTLRASADVLEQRMYVNVAHHIILMAVEKYQPQAVWRPLVDGLQLWAYAAYREFDFGLANNKNNLLRQRLAHNVPVRLPALSIEAPPLRDLEEIPATRWQQSVVSKTVIDYVIGTYDRHSLARLLDGMHQYDSWQSLVPAVFGVSMAEFESGWQAYLAAWYELHP